MKTVLRRALARLFHPSPRCLECDAPSASVFCSEACRNDALEDIAGRGTL